MPRHALVTGTGIAGRIPVDSPDHPAGFVDVTPETLYFEHDDPDAPPPALLAVAEAIEAEHYVRDTHPVQHACRALAEPGLDVSEEALQAHRDEHAALVARFGGK